MLCCVRSGNVLLLYYIRLVFIMVVVVVGVVRFSICYIVLCCARSGNALLVYYIALVIIMWHNSLPNVIVALCCTW